MNTIFINSDRKTSEAYILRLKFINELDLRRDQKIVASSSLSICYTWKDIKSSYNNNKFKMSVLTWNDESELPDGLYSVSDIQDILDYI